MDLKKYTRSRAGIEQKNTTQEVMELKFDAFKKMLNFELMEIQTTMRVELANAFAESSTNKTLNLIQDTQQNDKESDKVSGDSTENSGMIITQNYNVRWRWHHL